MCSKDILLWASKENKLRSSSYDSMIQSWDGSSELSLFDGKVAILLVAMALLVRVGSLSSCSWSRVIFKCHSALSCHQLIFLIEFWWGELMHWYRQDFVQIEEGILMIYHGSPSKIANQFQLAVIMFTNESSSTMSSNASRKPCSSN